MRIPSRCARPLFGYELSVAPPNVHPQFVCKDGRARSIYESSFGIMERAFAPGSTSLGWHRAAQAALLYWLESQ